MAVHSSLDTILKAAEKHQLPYWRITNGNELIDHNDSEADLSAALNALQESLETLEGSGFVTVVLSSKSNEEKGARPSRADKNFVYRYKIGQAATIGGMGNTSTGGSFFSPSLFMNMFNQNMELTKMMLEQKSEFEKKELNNRIEALEKGDSNPLLEKALGFLPLLLGGAASPSPIAPAMAGTTEPATEAIEQMDLFKAASKRMFVIDPNFGSTLTALADFAEKDPDKYKSFIPLLKTL